MIKKILLLICAGVLVSGCTQGPSIYDDFAACITDGGTKMYGTEWCPHCKNQKEQFGSSFKNIDYIDCDIYVRECKDADIKGYPTWILPDGERLPGEQDLEDLAEKTECELPDKSTSIS